VFFAPDAGIEMVRRKFLKLANAINRGEFANNLDFDSNGMFVSLGAFKIYLYFDEGGGRLVLWSEMRRVEPDETEILADTCAIYTQRNYFERNHVLVPAGAGRVGILGYSMDLDGLDTQLLVSRIRNFANTARAAQKLLDTKLTTARIADAHRITRELFSYGSGDY
jgi:hypothetical protein